MTELELKIKNFADAYYNGNEQISDAEYDALIARLKQENPNSPLIKNGVVGSDLKGVSKKYKLPVTMGTLAKCMTDKEFSDWWSKHATTTDIIAETKIDGNGVLLEYKDGKLTFVYSRGDSEYAEDLTANVSKVKGVIKNLKENFTGYIRGEVVLKRSIFESDKSFANMANPRNAVAGVIKRLDGKDGEKLNFIGYDVFGDHDDTEMNKINFLKEQGFDTPRWWLSVSEEDVIELKNNIKELRKEADYDIDGIVIKQNNVDKEDLMRKTPLKNCALKPDPDIKITKILGIEWQLKGRYFSPVAIVEPVEIEGAIVNKASLANINIMIELGVEIGDNVYIKRAGEIIPKIIGKCCSF